MCTFIKNVYLIRCNLLIFIYIKTVIMIITTILKQIYFIKNVYFCVLHWIVLSFMKPNY
jgi:hypothetical protein